ncbi:putative PEP-binding protein, partial [Serratia bockelmannii]|uniref:putative PEP-binding protein n=1 Tax=Serratia bockelmannii TaxID=2703793 RepID=UPI003D0693F9
FAVDPTKLMHSCEETRAPSSRSQDELNVKALLSMAIQAAKRHGKYVGICGQGPSDHEDFAEWLMEQGIDSLSLNPDTVVQTWINLSKKK